MAALTREFTVNSQKQYFFRSVQFEIDNIAFCDSRFVSMVCLQTFFDQHDSIREIFPTLHSFYDAQNLPSVKFNRKPMQHGFRNMFTLKDNEHPLRRTLHTQHD